MHLTNELAISYLEVKFVTLQENTQKACKLYE